MFTVNRGPVKTLCAGVVGGLFFANAAFPAGQDLQLAIRSEGNGIEFEVRGASRQQALERLLADSGIELQWRDFAVANEAISGTFKGTSVSVARRLLAQTNFVVVYDEANGFPRITRVVIMGRSTREQASQSRAPLDSAPIARPQQSAKREELTRNVAVDARSPLLTKFTTGADSVPVIIPFAADRTHAPPAPIHAPSMTPPLITHAALRHVVPVLDATAPVLLPSPARNALK